MNSLGPLASPSILQASTCFKGQEQFRKQYESAPASRPIQLGLATPASAGIHGRLTGDEGPVASAPADATPTYPATLLMASALALLNANIPDLASEAPIITPQWTPSINRYPRVALSTPGADRPGATRSILKRPTRTPKR